MEPGSIFVMRLDVDTKKIKRREQQQLLLFSHTISNIAIMDLTPGSTAPPPADFDPETADNFEDVSSVHPTMPSHY
jgi:hypothetical protein